MLIYTYILNFIMIKNLFYELSCHKEFQACSRSRRTGSLLESLKTVPHALKKTYYVCKAQWSSSMEMTLKLSDTQQTFFYAGIWWALVTIFENVVFL